MIVCLCTGVTESEIKQCIEEQGAHSLETIQEACSAGTCCQSCHPEILSLLYEENISDCRSLKRSSDS